MNMNLQVLPSRIRISPQSVDYFRSELELLTDETGLPIDEITPEELAKLVDSNKGLQATVNGMLKNTSFTRTDLYRVVLGLPLTGEESGEEPEAVETMRTKPLCKPEVMKFHSELKMRLPNNIKLKDLSQDDIKQFAEANSVLRELVQSIIGSNNNLAENLYLATTKYIQTGKIDLFY